MSCFIKREEQSLVSCPVGEASQHASNISEEQNQTAAGRRSSGGKRWRESWRACHCFQTEGGWGTDELIITWAGG